MQYYYQTIKLALKKEIFARENLRKVDLISLHLRKKLQNIFLIYLNFERLALWLRHF
jgi:hypothetical protein